VKPTPLKEVPTGAVLAESVTNNNGDVLLKKGAQIQERHIRLLQMWGVSTLVLTAGDGPPDESQSPKADDDALDRAEQELKRYFGESLNNEIMAEIFRLAVIHRASAQIGAAD